jgi:hypothetical protein
VKDERREGTRETKSYRTESKQYTHSLRIAKQQVFKVVYDVIDVKRENQGMVKEGCTGSRGRKWNFETK